MVSCVFCRIIDGSAPAEMVYGDDHAVAFTEEPSAMAGRIRGADHGS